MWRDCIYIFNLSEDPGFRPKMLYVTIQAWWLAVTRFCLAGVMKGSCPPHTRLGAQLVNYSFLDRIQSRTQPLTFQSKHVVHAHSCIPSLSTSFRVILIRTLAEALSRYRAKSSLLGPSVEALFSILTRKYLFTLSPFLSPFSLGPRVHRGRGLLFRLFCSKTIPPQVHPSNVHTVSFCARKWNSREPASHFAYCWHCCTE